MKQGEDSRDLLMPLTETVSFCFFFLIFWRNPVQCAECSSNHLQILDAVVSKSLVKSIQDIIDDDGSVKDTAVWFLHPDSTLLFFVLY
jgi:hypothetical protein